MMNVNQITAQLARMPDQALQQYAAMHKEDPYIMALAVSEANRRKQMRSGAQMQVPEQPKVVDQELAQMAAPAQPQQTLPEDVGIARLPVGNMNFAGGGIVAFADGGGVERYQVGGATEAFRTFLQGKNYTHLYTHGTPADRAALEALFRAQIQGPMPTPAAPAAPAGTPPSAAASRLMSPGALGSAARVAPIAGIPVGIAAGLTSGLESMQAQGYPGDPAGEFSTGAMTPEQAAFDVDRVRKLEAQRAENARISALVEGREPAVPAADAESAKLAQLAASRGQTTSPGAGGPGAGGPGVGGPGAPTRLPGGLGDINAMLKSALREQAYEDPAKQQVSDLGKTLKEGAEGRLKAFDEYVQKTGDVFKGREERISKREGEIGKQKDTNIGLAFMEAGLATMSTPGGLAMAFGKGARVGTERFASGLEKIRAAQDKIDEARDRNEELKLNRADMTFKDRQALQSEIDKAKAEAIKMQIDGIRMGAGVTEKRAAEVLGGQIKVGIAQLEASRNQQLELLRAVGADPKLLATYQAMHGEKSGVMGEFTKWLKENPQFMSNTEEGQRTALQAFLRAKGVLASGSGQSGADGQSAGTVFPRKD